MGHKFHPEHVAKLEDPARLERQPPEVIIDLLQLEGDETVVDYGAGTGVYTLAVAEALPRGRVLAVDMSDELLARLRDKLVARPDLGARVEIVHTTDDRVPLPDGGADVVLAVDLWHEIHDEPPALAEMARLVRPGGTLLIVDWAPTERPVGPPKDHVVSLDTASDEVIALGFTPVVVREPDDVLPYHYVIAARRG